MVSCRQFIHELGDYVDGDLASSSRDECDHHMEECWRCRVLLETTRETVYLFRTCCSATIPPDVEERLMTAIERRTGCRSIAPHLFNP